MTKEQIIHKIEDLCEQQSNSWWIFKFRVTFELIEIQPYYTIQLIQQLPGEINIAPLFDKPIIVNADGIKTARAFYSWSTIVVTAIKSSPWSEKHLLLGLDNGEILEADIYNDRSGEAVCKMAHLIELYKIKYRKLSARLPGD